MTQRKPIDQFTWFNNTQKHPISVGNENLNNKLSTEKLGDTGWAFFHSTEKFSSINLSSHFDYNISASESVENADTGSQRNNLIHNKSKLIYQHLDPYSFEDKILQSGHTLELSDDEEEKTYEKMYSAIK